MADQKGLRAIGVGLSAITAAVTLVAALLVADATRSAADLPPVAASTTR
jgi:hypothetical protein